MTGEWKRTSLREAGVSLIDYDHRTPPAADSGYPYVAIPQLKEGRLALAEARRISPEHFAEWTRKAKPQHHDVILSRRCNPGETAFVPAGLECALGQNLVLLRSDGTKVFPPFLRWLLNGPDWWEQVGTFINVGAIFNSLKCADIPNFKMPLPPLAEQKAIAAVLWALDDKIELNRRMNATLEAMARALFQSCFVDFDPVRAKLDGRPPAALDPATAALFPDSFQDSTAGHIPSGWRVMKVGEFIERLSVGQKYEQKMVSPVGKVPVLDQGRSGVIGFHNNESGVTATLDKPVAVFANHTCYMRLITYSFSAIQNVLPFVGSGVDTLWAYYATKGRLSFSEYKGHWPDFVIQESAVPPRELTDAFGRLAKPLVAQMRNNEEESRTLATLRDTLLPKLLSGELSVAALQSKREAAR
jgi:type I restriction enzyme S subunit